jgi:hypothetical protein
MTSSQTTLGHNHSAFVMVEATDNIQALGTVHPRVLFELRLRTNSEKVQGEIHYLRLQVKFAGELLGDGASSGDFVDSHDRRMRIEVPMTRTALGFVSENLQADRLDLTLSLQGWMRIKNEAEEGQRVHNEPSGEWWFTTFGINGMAEISLQIARGDWFKRVLEPLGSYEYVLTEVPLLKGGLNAALQSSLRQIKEAERLFAEGNDPAVFLHCKGMVEALPGWPKEIFADMVDTTKAEHLDRLVHATKQYYDHGRHIAQGGAHEGDFPVNHREALFAINMAKVLLAEIGAAISGA